MSETYYYFIWVRSSSYRKSEPLTYSFNSQLPIGSIVVVDLKDSQNFGVVVGRTSAPKFSTKAIRRVLNLSAIPKSIIQLGSWLASYYPSSLGNVTTLLLPRDFREEQPTEQKPFSETDTLVPLEPATPEQAIALDSIQAPGTYILHGRTGSGKTRVYVELAQRTLQRGESVIVLSPEIGLTTTLVDTFRRFFGSRVTMVHSRQTEKTRTTNWQNILRSHQPQIIIGPRSALFSPVNSVGLIVIDEFHDQSYKQEQSPRYQAVRVAAMLSNIHNAILVLGSATPPVVEYYIAEQKHRPILHLEKVAISSKFNNNYITVDMAQRELFSRSAHISLPLIDQISKSLDRNEQSLLYLNRRGTARVTACENCGWSALCPRCDIPLIYHGDLHTLACHICSYKRPPPFSCPECNNPSITFRSFGTKAIVTEVQKLFPEARIMRFDLDNSASERIENNFEQISAGDVDILIGTQIITKGLDLPRLSTLGVILADTSLFTPDYTAQERTYQLVSQVIGRIGRGHRAGTAIIQTYQPNSPIIRAAINVDWKTFYDNEIAERRKYYFPPFCHLLKITVRRKTEKGAERAAATLRDTIVARHRIDCSIVGPAPAFHFKSGGYYQWQLVLKSVQRKTLLEVISGLPTNGYTYDIDPVDLL